MMKNKIKKRLLLLCALSISLVGTKISSGESVNSSVHNIDLSTASNTQNLGKVKIKDARGEVEVPVNPKKVIALDNVTFETLEKLGVKVMAVPKPIMTNDSLYKKDDGVLDIGNHREPNLEIIASVDPDLIIIGSRFSKYYDDIKNLAPNASIVDFTINGEGQNGNPGENLVMGLKESTISLGRIFNKNEEAKNLVSDFEKSISDAKEAYKDKGSVMGIIVSGGEIGYSAPKTGRVWGPIFEVLGLKPALEVSNSSSNHQGDDISVEAIAKSNPSWILVLDRDAPLESVKEKTSAKEVIEKSQALINTEAIKKGNVIYAPNETYINESIVVYTKLFNTLKDNFNK